MIKNDQFALSPLFSKTLHSPFISEIPKKIAIEELLIKKVNPKLE